MWKHIICCISLKFAVNYSLFILHSSLFIAHSPSPNPSPSQHSPSNPHFPGEGNELTHLHPTIMRPLRGRSNVHVPILMECDFYEVGFKLNVERTSCHCKESRCKFRFFVFLLFPVRLSACPPVTISLFHYFTIF
jgi:hypothetical protein